MLEAVLGGEGLRVWKTVLVSERFSMSEGVLEGVNLRLLKGRVLPRVLERLFGGVRFRRLTNFLDRVMFSMMEGVFARVRFGLLVTVFAGLVK